MDGSLHNMKKYIFLLVGFLLLVGVHTVQAQQQSALRPSQGGTGISSATNGDIGLCLKVLDDSPFTYELGACGGGGGGGGDSVWSRTIGGLIYTPTTTDSVAIGGISTSSAEWYYDMGRFVNYVFGSLGIGTTSPAASLAVAGNSYLGGNVTATGTLAVQGTGTSTFAGDVRLSGTSGLVAAHGIQALDSAGLSIRSNNFTSIATLGAGGGSNVTFNGGVNIDGQTRLATSLTGLLRATSGIVSTSTVSLTADITGVLPVANGGTNIASYTTGDLLYASGATTLSKLGIGSTNHVLAVVGGVPAWVATSTLGFGGGSGGITSLNSQTGATQTFASSTTGFNDFQITSSGNVHTFTLPSASASVRGLLTSADWSTFNNKVSSTSIDTIAEIETLIGSVNIIVATEIDTSAELATILTDETGTGSVVFSASPTFTGTATLANFIATNGTTTNATSTNLSISGAFRGAGLSDCDTASSALTWDITTGNFGCNTITGGGGGSGGGWATTTGNNGEPNEILTFTSEDVLIGGSASNTAEFGFDVERSKLTISSTTDATAGEIAISSTTPSSKLSIHAMNGGTYTSLFRIGSSTASATTTLFDIANTGSTTAANGINISTGCFAVNGTCVSNVASAAQNGILSSADWSTFNNKVSTTSIDSISEIETLVGAINIIVSTEIDTSAELAAILTDETGTGSVVFSASPTLTGVLTFASATGTNATSTNFYTQNLTVGTLSGFLRATNGVVSTSSVSLTADVTGILPVANGGTATSSPVILYKPSAIQVTSGSSAITTGDGKAYFRIPKEYNGMNLIDVDVAVTASSSSGAITVQVARGRQASVTSPHAYVDMLSTSVTIDANEMDSKDAATQAVVNTANDDVREGDLIRVDLDGVGSAPSAVLIVQPVFALP